MLRQIYRTIITAYLRLKTLWKPYGYFGSYSSWDKAMEDAGSYDDETIFNRVLEASRKVRDGEATYERDGMAFYDPFKWEALAYFQEAAAGNPKLKVLDFGGALGSHYFPTSRILKGLQFDWTIVEQAGFVELGNKEFATDNLHFEADLENALQQSYDLILLGCVLPYLPEPEKILHRLLQAKPKYVLIDKHPVIAGEDNRLTVQRIPPSIYEASYPAWFFSEPRFKALMSDYELVDFYDCPDIFNINSQFKTYFYKLK